MYRLHSASERSSGIRLRFSDGTSRVMAVQHPRRGKNMKVKDIMTASVEYVAEDDTVAHAARLMKEDDIGALPVRNEKGKLTGMVTDRDIVLRAIAEGRDVGSTKVSEIMSGGLVWCDTEQTVEQVARLMENRQVRRLLVLDQQNAVAGMVSLGDVAVKCLNRELAGEVVLEISRPGHHVV
jgi:CBS domain-containing protein